MSYLQNYNLCEGKDSILAYHNSPIPEHDKVTGKYLLHEHFFSFIPSSWEYF